ncbi:32a11d89-de71-4da2-a057-eb27ca4080dd, partial [Sclerotinia trifoliorum]
MNISFVQPEPRPLIVMVLNTDNSVGETFSIGYIKIKIARYYEGKTDQIPLLTKGIDDDEDEEEDEGNESQDKLEGIPEEPIETTETSDTPLSETKDEDPPLQEGDGSKEEENNDVPSLTEETQSTESDKPPSTTEESSDSKLIESSPNTEESLARDITEAELELASNNNIENPSDPTPNTNDNTAPSVPDPLPRDDIHDDIHDNIHDDGHALSRVNSHGLHSSHHVVHFADEIESTSSKSRSKSNKSGNDKKTAPPAVPRKPEALSVKRAKVVAGEVQDLLGKLSRTIGSSNSPSGDPDDSDPQSRGKKRKAKDGKEKRQSNDPITTCNEGVDSAQEPQETPGVVQPASDPEPAAISDDNPGEDVEKINSYTRECGRRRRSKHGEHSITGEVSAGDVSTVEDVQREVGEIANTKETPIVYQDVQIHEEIPVPNEAPEITDDKSTTADGLDVNTEDSSSEPVSEATVENPVTNEEVFPPDEHGPQESEVTEEIPSSEDASTITNESSVHSEESSDPVESISTNAIGEKDPSHIETPTISDEIEPKDDVPSSVEPAVVKESTNLSQEAPPLAEHVFEKGIVSEPESEAQLSEESIENSPSEEPNIQEGIINSTESASVPVEASVTIDNGLQAVDEREGSSGANQRPRNAKSRKAGPENIDTLEVGEDQVDKEAILNESYSEANEDISKELESRDIDDDTETHGGPSEKVETGDVEDHVEDSHVEDDIVQDLAPTDDINEAPVVETNTGEDSSALENSNAKRESETIEPSDDIPNVPVPVLVEDSTQNQEKCAPERKCSGSPASEEPSDENQLENSPVIIEENSEPEISVSFEHTSPKTGEIKDNLKSEEGPITVDQPSIEVENPKKSQEFEEAPAEIEESQEIQANEGTTEQPKTEDLPSVGEDGPGLKNASPTEDAGNSHESPESDEIADLLMPEQDVMIEETHEQNEEEGSIEKDPELIKKAEKSLQEVAPLPEIDHNVTPVHTEDTFELLGEISQPEPAEEELSTDIPKENPVESQADNTKPEPMEELPANSSTNEHGDGVEVEELNESDPAESENDGTSWDGDSSEDSDSGDEGDHENDETPVTDEIHSEPTSKEEDPSETEETKVPVLDSQLNEVPAPVAENSLEFVTEKQNVQADEPVVVENPDFSFTQEETTEKLPESVDMIENIQSDETVTIQEPDISVPQGEPIETSEGPAVKDSSESVDEKKNTPPSEEKNIEEIHVPVPEQEQEQEQAVTENPAISAAESHPGPASEEDNPTEDSETEDHAAPVQGLVEDLKTSTFEENSSEPAIEEEEPSQSEEIVTSEQVNLAAPVENSAENTDTAEVENSPAPHESKEVLKMPVEEEIEYESVIEDKNPIHSEEFVSDEDPDASVPKEQTVESVRTPAAPEEVIQDEATEDVTALTDEEPETIDDDQSTVDDDEIAENAEATLAELESAPVDSILVQTVVVEEPLVETPPEEDISEKYAEPDSTPTETIPTEEPDTEDQVAEQPTADLTQDIPAETESESTPTDTTPAPVQEPVSLELPLEPEAGKCPLGYEFLSNRALDPVHRAPRRDVKLINISSAANDPIPEPEPVAVE